VYPQFVPTYERAVGNYCYSDYRGVGRQVNFEATNPGWISLQLEAWLLLQPSVVYGGLGPYGLRSGYNGYGLGYNGYGWEVCWDTVGFLVAMAVGSSQIDVQYLIVAVGLLTDAGC
ncbi:hypothetical protein CEXT_688191, partial [Caerostris extrusa]